MADYANVIPAQAEHRLNSLLITLEQQTTAAVCVLTVHSTDGVPIEQFAVRTFEQWGIGRKDKDNGVLIVVAVADRKYRIEVGYGLEGALTDAACHRLAVAYFVPNFRRGRYGEGLYQAALEMTDMIAREYGAEIPGLKAPQLARRTPDDSRRHMRKAGGGLCACVFPLLMLVLVFSSIGRRRGLRGWGGGWAWPFLFGMGMGSSFGRSSWGGGGGFGGGGFGGFGGGMSGGGGASGGW